MIGKRVDDVSRGGRERVEMMGWMGWMLGGSDGWMRGGWAAAV